VFPLGRAPSGSGRFEIFPRSVLRCEPNLAAERESPKAVRMFDSPLAIDYTQFICECGIGLAVSCNCLIMK